jgi:very-short-patch-repair endonuclease
VIEVDGNQHFSPEAMEYDRERTKYFKAMDIDVIRFTNQEVAQQFQSVCDRIDCAVKERMKVLHH